jgi:hypothetical protein
MVTFKIESWAALAPTLDSHNDWIGWLQTPHPLSPTFDSLSLKQVPPLLRRRFNTLGKCAMSTLLTLLNNSDRLPSVFASRHGDTALTLSLLENMGKKQAMSPTDFSLAVHNAVGGLYTIARQDTSAVTAIASMEGLITHALIEAIGQLNDSPRVLCVIYDAPLPPLYQASCPSESFPYSIALILNKDQGRTYSLEQLEAETLEKQPILPSNTATELRPFISLLTGLTTSMTSTFNHSTWSLHQQDAHVR